MTNISNNSIYSDVFNIIYDVVSGCVSAGSVKLLVSAFPDYTAKNFPGYPVCVVEPADISKERLTLGSNNISIIPISIAVGIHSKSMATLDQLSDKVYSGLDFADKNGLMSGLYQLNIGNSPVTTNLFNNDRVHSRVFGLTVRV